MKYFKFLAWLTAFVLIVSGGAWALSEFNDEVINGEWTFQQDTKFTKSITLNGTTYTSLAVTDWDSIGDPDANSAIDFTDYYTSFDFGDTDHDMLTIQGTGAFGDVSVVRIEQKTGNATNGTVLEVVSADTDADALVVTANSTTVIQAWGSGNVDITGGTGALDFTDFDVTADGAVTLACDLGGTMITLTPSAAAVGIDASNATLTTALSVGANDIVGTTGLINYTGFDVDASGNIVSAGNLTAVDGIFSGNVNITGTFQQDSITAFTAATTLTVDGTGAGGVTIGGTSTGTITLGGGSVLVNLPTTVDMTISGGSLTMTDTANSDLVNLTNNTTTTGDIIEITANGILTSGSAIKITTPAATTANVVSVTADGLTSGNIFYADSIVAGFTGAYFYAYDGAAEDFSVKADGITTIAGTAGGAADSLVLTLGNVQVTSGDVDVDDGQLTVDTAQDLAHNISRNFNGAGSGPVLTVAESDTDSTQAALYVTNSGTGNATGVSIAHAGDNPTLYMVAGAARTGDVIQIPMANQLNQRAINITGAITSVAGGGTIEVHGTGIIPATASLLRLDADTAQPGDGDGWMLNIDDDTLVVATPSKYAVLIDSNANEALHVATGKALFDEAATFTSGIDADGDIDIDFNQTTEEMMVSQSGEVSGAGGAIVTLESTLADVTTQGYVLKLQVADDADVDADYMVVINDSDGTPDVLFTITDGGNVLTEGTLTVNGAQIIGDGATEMVGVRHDVVDAAATNPYTITAAMSGTVFYNSQAVEFDLPADPTGLEFTFVVGNASNLHIDPNGADQIVHSTCAAGDRIVSATVGDTVTLVGLSADAWYVKAMYPAATDFTDAD